MIGRWKNLAHDRWLLSPDHRGGVAQLGEHLLCKQGVVGSSPITSTISSGYPCGLPWGAGVEVVVLDDPTWPMCWLDAGGIAEKQEVRCCDAGLG